MTGLQGLTGGRELVMVSNRLPVDRVVEADGSTAWRTSPGGLVTAVEPIVEQLGCVWVGWAGSADEHVDPFEIGRMRLEPVELSTDDVELYYEGFSNGTLWPLYHDVIAPPEFHRQWWDRYRKVNQRFAERVAAVAAEGAIAWIHDYQLQLVPAMLRELRPDLTIGFFLHIPFPPRGLFEQLPWRRSIISGLLGADVIGFQRVPDAISFRTIADRYTHTQALGNTMVLPATTDAPGRTVLAQEFPISIDAAAFAEVARRPETQDRARQIRAELGNPKTVMLGVDRLDYTKGIRHRLKAFDELLIDDEIDASQIVLVQVASPSRERVDAYRQLRDEVEVTVGRINGEHGTIGHAPLVYLHRGYSREEMVAMYLAADVLVVTPLRDGMNLVAKEYVACREDEQGVLILSEFAGAADELRDALLVNPHDIEGLKAAMLRAVHMPQEEQHRRMHGMRRAVHDNDVAHWASGFLGSMTAISESRATAHTGGPEDGMTGPISIVPPAFVPRSVGDRLRRIATASSLLVATDFDGTIAPIVRRPQDARMLPRARQALELLNAAPGVRVALLSGRSLDGLAETGTGTGGEGWIISGSHGSELTGLELPGVSGADGGAPTAEEVEWLQRVNRRFERVLGGEPGVRLERKPFGIAVHTREVRDPDQSRELQAAAVELGIAEGLHVREGKEVREFSVRASNKGAVLQSIRDALPSGPVLFLGDDVTDEDAFAVLGPDDLGIKVGPGDTAATGRVPDPETVAAVLARLVELRTGIVIGSD
ncbi:bifunctional alpha,alpha-trehalose-phosphate synthase (UDP-forming)/trehalose-phosphatase [Leucobacter musarum]|uniref:bifunctional alpha,alpha-trehalose-phosphate synthase (UDP-forming)/trehalose-phosphatase n=1 Tax=Leucobacter musarum TaxID=1930747 RepID=UPI0006A7A529|nr:bifunctional alpha,alpha-trehalose-phosphate synthase (UDP-forming)/trehalose-phosphatase [Leucobacter musarum]